MGGFLGLVPGVVNDGLLFVLFGEKFLFYIVIVLNKLKNDFGSACCDTPPWFIFKMDNV